MKIYTSANTSINKNKLPSAYRYYTPLGDVLDYGAGKYTEHICDYVHSMGAHYYPYDPYNQSDSVNTLAFQYGERKGFDTVYCCNVLNVINCDDIIFYVCRDLLHMCKIGGRVIIQIYEGNKSGKGRETKPDCYQRNEKTTAYLWVLEKLAYVGYDFVYQIYDNYIVLVKRGENND